MWHETQDRNEGNNPGMSPFYSHSSSRWFQEVCRHFTCIIPPHLHRPVRLPAIYSCFYLPNFMQLVSSCQNSDFSPTCI